MPHSASVFIQDILLRAEEEIFATYGDRVSFKRKKKSLRKFGRRTLTSADTLYTISEHLSTQYETLLTANSIDTLSSSSANDGETIEIEGHTISGNDLTFVSQQKALNGQNKVTLDTPLARITRLKNVSSTELEGTVYGYVDGDITAGVPDSSGDIHIIITAGKQQSEKSSTSISKDDYWCIVGTYFAVSRGGSTANVDYSLEFRRTNGVFLPTGIEGSVRSNGQPFDFIDSVVPVVIPKNSDTRIIAASSSMNTPVFARAVGYLGSVIS